MSNKRRFELPAAGELSEEQEDIEDLPLEEPHLIVGGPGTGKSVLCLSRARLLNRKNKPYLFLVFNVLLERATQQLYPDVVSGRWISWVSGEFRKRYNKIPRKKSKNIGDYDWAHAKQIIANAKEDFIDQSLDRVNNDVDIGEIFGEAIELTVILQGRDIEKKKENLKRHLMEKSIDVLKNVNIKQKSRNNDQQLLHGNDTQYFILDEGQDMPVGFYDVLIEMGWENLFVAADENQSITSQNSTIGNLRDVLGLCGVDEQHDLHENFRQRDKGFFVAQLAKQFYCERASDRLELPPKSQSTEMPSVYQYPAGGIVSICMRIIMRCQNNPKELIGILTPNNEIRGKYLQALRGIQQNDVQVSTYASGMSSEEIERIHFDRGGVIVINAQSCKGLEFDTVFIADINHFWVSNDQCTTKKLFYVMISRARERVYLLRDGAINSCPVEKERILPRDENILKRNYQI